jgi:hypothetical protein
MSGCWVCGRVREILGLNEAMRPKAWRNLAGVLRNKGQKEPADFYDQQAVTEDTAQLRTIAGLDRT